MGLIAGLLREKAKEENLAVDEEALLLIARQATGSFRDAISLLDQLTSTGLNVTLAEAQVVLGTATNEKVLGLVESILTRDAAAGFQCIQSALDSGSDARQFARQVVEYLRGLLLVRMNNAALIDATAEMRAQMADHAGRFDTAGLLEAIRAFNAAAADTRSNWQPGLGLELALAEAVSEKPAPVVTVVQAPAAQSVVHPTAQPVFQPAARSEQPAAPVAAPASQRATAKAEAQAPRAQTEKTAGTAEKPPAEHSGEATGQGADLGQIRQGWARIRQVVRQRSALTAAALNSCRTFTIKDGILVLGYQNDLLKSKMETEDNLALLKAALQGVLGVSMPVRCVVIGNKTTWKRTTWTLTVMAWCARRWIWAAKSFTRNKKQPLLRHSFIETIRRNYGKRIQSRTINGRGRGHGCPTAQVAGADGPGPGATGQRDRGWHDWRWGGEGNYDR